VTLATGIPEAVVRSVNLDYLDPDRVDPAVWAAEPGTLVVPDAGEVLYRLRDAKSGETSVPFMNLPKGAETSPSL
jgi:hypothetical protein